MGCGKDFLLEDPKGQPIGSAAITDMNSLQQLMFGAYHTIAQPWSYGINDGGFLAAQSGSDDLCAIPKKAELAEFDVFVVTSFNDRIKKIWDGLYKSIQCANGVILYSENIEPKNDEEAAMKTQIVGEAYFMRAFDYYMLVRFFGDIPMILDPAFSPAMLTVEKTPVAQIYEQIISDLEQAETLMDDEKPAPGRVNKGAAKAYLADVYLTMAGWPLHDDSKYALAAAKAKEVIDNQDAYGFNLDTPLDVLWNGDPTADRKSEEIFALYLNPSQGTLNTTYGAAPKPECEGEGGWDDYLPEIYFFKQFPEGIRKDLTFQSVMHTPNGDFPYNEVGTKHPNYRKFYSTEGVTWAVSNAVCYYRFATVLLTYAEAQCRATGTPNTEAFDAVNAVRNRAGLPDLDPSLTGDEFAKAVFDERGWEMAGESTRYFDLKRMEMVDDVNAPAMKDPDDYPIRGQIYNYLPLPAADKQLNPNL